MDTHYLRLKLLQCIRAEDDVEDEVVLNVIPDGNKNKRVRWEVNMDDGDTYDQFYQNVPFENWIVIKLWDLDWPDPNDKLGKATVGTQEITDQTLLFRGSRNPSIWNIAAEIVVRTFTVGYATAADIGLDPGEYGYLLTYDVLTPSSDTSDTTSTRSALTARATKRSSSVYKRLGEFPLSVTKRDGRTEEFSQARLATSMTRAGASKKEARLVATRVASRAAKLDTVSSKKLSEMTARSLSKVNLSASRRYQEFRNKKYPRTITSKHG